MASEAGGESLRILVVRPDRLGDVILSTPVFEVIKRHYPRSHLAVMLRKQNVSVIKGLASVDDTIIYDPDRRHSGIRGFFRLVAEIRRHQFRIAVVLQSHWKIAAAIFFAKVRYRVGPLSKIHSFLFYNRGIRQHRSQVEMHETDYNLQLLRRLGIRVGTRNVPTRVFVSEESKAKARQWLEEKGWKPGSPIICVHPGMGGSALNWPETHYIEFIRALLKEGRQILLTAGPSEGPLLTRIQEGLGNLKDKAWYYGATAADGIDVLAALYVHADLVVAPSTGPVHLAVALGKPVVTFYPPIRVQSAIRWGPYLPDESRASILVPEMYCGQDFSCLGSMCNYYPCMKSLTVTQALEQTNRQLAKSQETRN